MLYLFYVKRRDKILGTYEIGRVSQKRPLPASKAAKRPVFGRRMRAAREQLGLPQDRLGVMIGIDEGSASARMSRYETGVHEPPVAIARLLALVLKVPLAYLYCDDDDLADIILSVHQLSPVDRSTLQKSLRTRVYGDGGAVPEVPD